MKVINKRVENHEINQNLRLIENYLEGVQYEESINIPKSFRRDAGVERQSK
jgi:hypothetical protein